MAFAGEIMPRPANGRDLITIEAGAPDFRRGNWWSTYKEARVFLLRGFSDAMALLELNSVEHLQRFDQAAAAAVRTQTPWTQEQLAVRSHWVDCSRPQLTRAAAERPMLLTKAVLAMECLQLYAEDKGVAFDVYRSVQIIPAAYRPIGFELQIQIAEKNGNTPGYKSFIQGATRLGQDYPDLLLRDIAKGEHATFPVANLVKTSFVDRDIVVRPAERPGRRGVTPASEYCKA